VSKATWRTLAVSLCLLFGGALSSATFAQAQPPQGRPAPGSQNPTLPSPVSETRMGMWRGRPVTYQVIDGRNIYQGDIILENVQPMPQAGGAHPASVGLADSNFLWPIVNGVAQIPYVIDPASTNPNLNSAISIYNSTFAGVIQLVPRGSQANYIDINLNSNIANNGVCEATEGDAHQGEQMVTGAGNCTVATILHEFGHVTGVWHEQSRTDAGTYVTFNEGNVIKGSIGNFLPAVDNDQQNLGFYDYASIMEYPAFSFSRNGGPPLDSIPAGMPLSNSVGYSAADVEGIMRLYGVAPTEVTVTSNPLGLQVSVDGTAITTPMTFSWTLNSTHTLAVATGVQTVNGIIVDSSDPQEPTTFYYQYGRWNDGGAQSHTITVTPGNGDTGFPVSAPQVATYTANFVQLVPYTPSVSPSGSGSVALTGTPAGPQMITVNGTPGTYVVARQQATLTATANSGYSFYEFNNGPYWLPGGLGSNPKTFYVPDSGLTLNTTVEFTSAPVYTIDVTPNYFSSNLGVDVDGTNKFWPVPKNFSSDPNLDGSAWNSGTMHTLQFNTPQGPFSVNTQFVFSTWTPGGTANPLSITLPAASQSYIATIDPEYAPATNFNFPPCGGTAAITPASMITGGFYPSGTTLTYTETPATNTGGTPWIFTGWTWDLTGTTNPDTLSPTDESLVYANFNTTSAPLTIMSLSPSSVASGGSAFTLTINGTGFTQNGTGNPIENVGFNFPSIFLAPTFVSSTELQVTVPATDIATPGTLLLFVENFPSSPWTGCAVFADQPFFVHQGTPSGATTVTAAPGNLSFPSTVVDQTSATQAITVTNTGSTATTIAITASTNFTQTNNCPVAPATLAGSGASCTINAMFAPTSAGNLTGNIAVTDSAANSPQIVTLSGTATPAVTTVTATPSSIAFGSEPYGTTTTSPTTIAVQNTGSASTSIAIAASANYSQINNCGTLLQVGTSCTITVSFTPTANGSLPGTISITDSATNSPQTVTLSGTGTGAPTVTVTVTPTTLTFGSQLLGTSSASQGVTVKNTSTLSTTLSVGAATGDYAESGNTCGSSLGAGASCTFNVTFTPTATGTRTGSISITDQATNSPQSVSLTGTGFSVIVAPTPSSLTFTSQTVGTTSASQPVSVKNTGTGTTTLSIGAATGDFAQTNNCSSTLAAGASCTVNVTFTPTVTGTRTGSILITDQASNSPQTVSLTGTGSSGTVTITVTPATETFAAQALNTTSASKAVTVKNTGTGSTTISIAPATGDFAQTNNCPVSNGTLGAGASCTISVTFTPTATGTRSGSIAITDQASNSPQSVSLTGMGVAQVTLSPTTLAFGNEAVGSTTAAKIVTMTNNLSTTLSGISFSTGTNYSAVAGTTTPCGATLAAKAHCTISVTFSPTTTGSLPGTLTVMDSANNSPQTVTLSGTGTAPVVITVTPASETFAAQAVGTPSAGKVITVKNTGGQSTSIATALSGDFSASPNTCNGTLGAGATCSITAVFTPSTTGSISGVITITDQGLNSPQIVTLTGTAVAPVTFSAASLAFGSQAVDTTSTPAKTVTMKNNSPNMLSGITIAASGNYSLPASGTPCGSSLAAGATCIISVTFTPTANGSIDGAVTVTYPAAYSPQEIKLTGTGTGGGSSPLKFTPASIAFASQGVGSTSAGKTVTVQNISASPVTFSSIATSGNFSEAGSGTTPCTNTSVLAASGSCTLSVTFMPSIAGAIQGALVISDNATPVGQQVVNLTGTAVLPVTIAPASLTFASQTHNTTSPPQTLTLTNNSGATLTSLSFAGSADFSVAPGTTMPCSTSLAAGAKCTLSVTFTPGRTGSIPGAATITDGASTSPQVVKLTGTGS